MGYLYYTLIGIGLYFVSDWLLDRLEEMYGARFKYRSLVFFAIITTLALLTAQIASLYG
ncbi:MAG: hypothetical protein HY846_00035 [Nitrosomonadales bacterium]|nr:hypothetical protein [Nitrosomonadales bacterium]